MKKNIIIATLSILLVLFVMQYVQARHQHLFLECMRDGCFEYTDTECYECWKHTSLWNIPSQYVPFNHY